MVLSGGRSRVPVLAAIVGIAVGLGGASSAALTPAAQVRGIDATDPATPCFSTDNGFPRLVAASVSPSEVDVRQSSGWVDVTVNATDEGGPGPATGLRRPEVSFEPLFTATMGTLLLRRQSDGTWRTRVLIPRGTRPGTYSLGSVLLRDRGDIAGHAKFYDTKDLHAMGQSIDVTVLSERDRHAPVLRSLQLSRDSVDLGHGPRTVRVTARVTDDIAGTSAMTVSADANFVGVLHLRRGTPLAGTWRGTIHVSRWEHTTFSPFALFIGLQDRVGKSRNYYGDDLAARGFPSTLTLTSPERDRKDPRLRHLTVRPSTVDVSAGDQKLTFTVRAGDRGSGIADVYAWSTRIKRVSGTTHDGVWRGVIPIDHCLFSHTRAFRPEVAIDDRAGNRLVKRPTITVVNNTDVRPPFPKSITPTQAGPSEPVTFLFNEDIAGISATSAPVRHAGEGAGFGTDDPPPAVAGTWTCASAAGSAVDCLIGPVRSATFTPASPLTPGQYYGVDFNPEHVLDVKDLSGNPIDPSLRYEDEFALNWSVHT